MSKSVIVAGGGHCADSAAEGLAAAGIQARRCEELEAADVEAADLVVLAGYKPLLPEDWLALGRVVNVHYSLLPRFRGLHSVIWAMLSGDEEVGVTIHEVDAFVDHGDVIWQARVPVGDANSQTLMTQLDDCVAQEGGRALREYLEGSRAATPQDHSAATFCGRRTPEDCRVDWQWSAVFFERFLRALVPPYPRPFFEHRGRRYELSDAGVVHRPSAEIPGRVVYRDAEAVWIKLRGGLLVVREVIRDGETLPALEAFRRLGVRLAPGAQVTER